MILERLKQDLNTKYFLRRVLKPLSHWASAVRLVVCAGLSGRSHWLRTFKQIQLRDALQQLVPFRDVYIAVGTHDGWLSCNAFAKRNLHVTMQNLHFKQGSTTTKYFQHLWRHWAPSACGGFQHLGSQYWSCILRIIHWAFLLSN